MPDRQSASAYARPPRPNPGQKKPLARSPVRAEKSWIRVEPSSPRRQELITAQGGRRGTNPQRPSTQALTLLVATGCICAVTHEGEKDSIDLGAQCTTVDQSAGSHVIHHRLAVAASWNRKHKEEMFSSVECAVCNRWIKVSDVILIPRWNDSERKDCLY